MAQLKAVLVIAAVLVLLELASAANYTVGAPGGTWDLKTNFSAWASAIKFKTGDNLNFSYSPTSHDVVEVTKPNYDSCTSAGAIKTYTTGKDVIPLTAAGKRYFICGVPGHCNVDGGMKVEIDTTAASGSPPSAGSPPPSTSPSTPTSSPPPAGTTPSGGSSPPPPPPSAASRLVLGGRMVAGAAGLLMVLAL